MSEIWKAIPGEKYFVSSEGRVRGPRGNILKPRKNGQGYMRVALGAGRDRYIHRLVCLAFYGPPPSGNHVDHINHERADNRLSNLRWVTPEENRARRLVRKGEDSPHAKLTDGKVKTIRARNDASLDKAFARTFGVSRETVRDARLGKLWRHVS